MGDGNGDHTRGTATWLNGVHPKWTEGADVRAGTTVDQIAARELGKDTPLPSLELGLDHNFVVGNCENGYSCVYMNTLAWRTPTTPLPMENNPRVVFERLFGEGGTAAQRLAQMRKTRSILDAVTEQMRQLQRTLGPAIARPCPTISTRVREVERRIQRAEATAASASAADPRASDGHPGPVRRARQTDVRPAVPGVPGRHHARLHVHARAARPARAASRRSAVRAAPRHVAPREQAGRHREVREGQHLLHASCSRISWRSCSRRRTATARCSITRCCSTAPGSATATSTRTSICRSCSSGGKDLLKGGRHLQCRAAIRRWRICS